MRFAIIADIHSHTDALKTVIKHAKANSADKIYCCGDIVGYHALPNETIDLVKSHSIISIAGNHDLAVTNSDIDLSDFWEVAVKAINWTKGVLTDNNQEYLSNLPRTTFFNDGFLLFHGAIRGKPFPEMKRIRNLDDVEIVFTDMAHHFPNSKLAFFGHTHVPIVYMNNGEQTFELHDDLIKLELNKSNRYIINPGSICLSRDGDMRSSYVIYDSGSETLHFYRTSYNNDNVLNSTKQAGLLQPRYQRIARRLLKRMIKKIGLAP
ncbi:MAG: metallophosphatase family protein [Candidatus Thiodiazotropha sp. (ex Notomyrtea botanica)]|nr:metallophosphatase family protein [Candidatus Thiodiazotropha sp. (ex Notomyrtea botanica)]